MKDLRNVATVTVEPGWEAQRIDNYLMRVCKGVPRSHIYRILRTGEVRINGRRVDATYRVQEGDRVRIPPIRLSAAASPGPAPALALPVIYEDAALLAVNKPAGLAVHGGSGVAFGVIERMRSSHPECKFLELVHRLDRDTSGVLLLAKKRSALTALHAAMREGRTRKFYTVYAKGRWEQDKRKVSLPLNKYLTGEGERRVNVQEGGKPSVTIFRRERRVGDGTLLSAELETGRTHQIRVHLSHLGHPIAGDDKYGDFAWNRALASLGLKRMFLHATRLELTHPATGEALCLEAPLPQELATFIDKSDRKDVEKL